MMLTCRILSIVLVIFESLVIGGAFFIWLIDTD